MLSVGLIVGGAFRLIKEKPLAVAIWGLVYLASGIVTTLTMRSILLQTARMNEDPSPLMPDFWPLFGGFFAAQLVLLLLLIVMFTAAMRAVLRPHETGIAHIRLGMDELRMTVLTILLGLLFYGVMLLALLILGALFAGIFAAGGGAGGVLLIFVVPLLVFGFVIWLYVRLSLAFPLTLLRRRIVIGESWRVTRGQFWTLFGAYLVVFIILIVMSAIVSSITFAPYMTELMRAAGNPDATVAAAQNQLQQMSEINAITVAAWIGNAVVGGVGIALLGGASATAARALAGDELLAREFA